MTYECFDVETTDRVAHLRMIRPERSNSMIASFWRDLPVIVDGLSASGKVRALVLSAEGRHFCSGMDLSVFAGNDTLGERGRRRRRAPQPAQRGVPHHGAAPPGLVHRARAGAHAGAVRDPGRVRRWRHRHGERGRPALRRRDRVLLHRRDQHRDDRRRRHAPAHAEARARGHRARARVHGPALDRGRGPGRRLRERGVPRSRRARRRRARGRGRDRRQAADRGVGHEAGHQLHPRPLRSPTASSRSRTGTPRCSTPPTWARPSAPRPRAGRPTSPISSPPATACSAAEPATARRLTRHAPARGRTRPGPPAVVGPAARVFAGPGASSGRGGTRTAGRGSPARSGHRRAYGTLWSISRCRSTSQPSITHTRSRVSTAVRNVAGTDRPRCTTRVTSVPSTTSAFTIASDARRSAVPTGIGPAPSISQTRRARCTRVRARSATRGGAASPAAALRAWPSGPT